ncbi:SRPBCC domain-containing protein [Pendulispora albinea]|uniref:SRPBCC domain-containing protein n=1 Tax=Pendulispora albinea TaxID=2741071 RepID=A0ABZ2LXU4_9BACT
MLVAATGIRISKPVNEVFEAVVDPRKMSQYFISFGSERLATGRDVVWKFEDFGATEPFSIRVKEVVDGQSIALVWSPREGENNSVKLTFEATGPNQTTVKVVEDGGWKADAQGMLRWAGQIEGWVNFMNNLKAYVEYGISLHRNGIVPGLMTAG